MKFVCTQKNLIQGLSKTVALAGKNKQLPILQCVLCQSEQGGMRVTSTDLEMGIYAVIPGKVEEEGSLAIPGRRLFEYAQQLPGQNLIHIQTQEKNTEVFTENFKANFPTAAADEFPLLPSAAPQKEILLPAEQLAEALGRVLFAAARDETRPEIHSVYAGFRQGKLYLAATDSFRLAQAIVPLKNTPEEFSFLLPLACAQEIIRLFNEEEEVRLKFHPNYIAVDGEGVGVTSRVVEGKYPDYHHIIPTKYETEGVVDKDMLLRALKTLTVFLPRDSRRVVLGVDPRENKIQFKVGSEAGEGDVAVPFKGEGASLKVAFNVQYLLEGLQKVATSQCKVLFGGASQPAVFKPTDSADDYLYVVMPIEV